MDTKALQQSRLFLTDINDGSVAIPNVYDILKSALSDGYYVGKGISIAVPRDIKFEIVEYDGYISLGITHGYPVIRWIKMRTPLKLTGVDFLPDYMTVKVFGWPDLDIEYG